LSIDTNGHEDIERMGEDDPIKEIPTPIEMELVANRLRRPRASRCSRPPTCWIDSQSGGGSVPKKKKTSPPRLGTPYVSAAEIKQFMDAYFAKYYGDMRALVN
jgi:hypothetical protein